MKVSHSELSIKINEKILQNWLDYLKLFTPIQSNFLSHLFKRYRCLDSGSIVLFFAKKTHQVLGCKGVTRSDFKFFDNKFNLLEINTQPGMTNLSLVPEIANYKGLSFENLVEKILLDASINRWKKDW